MRSPLGADEGLRFRRGIIIHRLLELLPELPTARRAAACRRYLARPAHGLAKAERDALAAETLAVLADPAFAPLFGRGSRAEVALAGLINGRVISGQVDRLLVAPQEVLAVDYKTNRPPPVVVNEVPALYLRQMAAYRALLRAVYPGRQVRMLLLWTEGPRRMLLPDGALDPYAP